eukprot:gb/GECG01003414.1/.p1 GENE.gb/GECG01003414.1/~~gb/GECG01003414.1/.p1  ORF type:complete len:344 (+),score=41.63 gb/GECG01003414.1/:1-1032(+)
MGNGNSTGRTYEQEKAHLFDLCSTKDGQTLDVEKVSRVLRTCGTDRDVNKLTNPVGSTLLHVAIRSGDQQLVQRLIEEFHADPEVRDNDGNTPLHDAVLTSKTDIVCRLLEAYNVDVNPKNIWGSTPLHWAARYGHLEIVKILTNQYKADTELTNTKGNKPVDEAKAYDKTEIAKYLGCDKSSASPSLVRTSSALLSPLKIRSLTDEAETHSRLRSVSSLSEVTEILSPCGSPKTTSFSRNENPKRVNVGLEHNIRKLRNIGVDIEKECPGSFICPLSRSVMVDPVVCADGYTYEKSEITRRLGVSEQSPKTKERMEHKNVVPNNVLLKDISDFVDKKLEELH